jgi:hypothetical protein
LVAIPVSACVPASLPGQACRVADSVRVRVPFEAPPDASYATLGRLDVPFAEIPLGIGHVHRSEENPVRDLPPGDGDWLRAMEIPLSASPGGHPSTWIAGGWVVRTGEPPEALTVHGMVETGYEEPSFVVLERRADGWLQILWPEAGGELGAAWMPACALDAGPIRLEFTSWSDWLLSDRISPLFFRTALPEELRSGPSTASDVVTRIDRDHVMEPLEVRGDWMRVVLKQPSDYCFPDVVPTRHEGWVRWRSGDLGPRVWYHSRGC